MRNPASMRFAASLVAQAEHGPDSEALLVSDDPVLSEAVASLVVDHDNVLVESVPTLADAIARVEEYAPEHLELHVADPDSLLPRIRNAGTVFVGGPTAIGDYAAGATHVRWIVPCCSYVERDAYKCDMPE